MVSIYLEGHKKHKTPFTGACAVLEFKDHCEVVKCSRAGIALENTMLLCFFGALRLLYKRTKIKLYTSSREVKIFLSYKDTKLMTSGEVSFKDDYTYIQACRLELLSHRLKVIKEAKVENKVIKSYSMALNETNLMYSKMKSLMINEDKFNKFKRTLNEA